MEEEEDSKRNGRGRGLKWFGKTPGGFPRPLCFAIIQSDLAHRYAKLSVTNTKFEYFR